MSAADQIATSILVALALGTLGAVASAASFVLLPEVVAKRHLATATSLLSGITGAAALFGPAIGGLLVVAGGVRTALRIDGISFLVAAVGYLVLRGRREPVAPDTEDTRSGFQVLWASPVLRRVLPFFYLGVFASVWLNASRLYFTTDVLGRSVAAFGLTGAAPPAGMVIGGLFGGWFHNRFGTRVAATAGFVVMGGSVALTGLLPSLWLMTVACVFLGVGNVVCNVTVKMSLIDAVPAAARSRGIAAYLALLSASFTPGVILGGVFGKSWPAGTMIASGLVTAGAGVGMWIFARSVTPAPGAPDAALV